jgi:carboxypeptidase T
VRTPDAEYKKPDDIERSLKATESNFPDLASVRSIGKSNDGRDIWAIQLTARLVDPGHPKPTILFDAMHHAREVMTPEVALDIVNELTTKYATDPDVQKWMNEYSIWVVPMVNPDGNNKVWEEDSMWRKNTRDGHGVDINRNYPAEWNTCGGSSGNKNSDIYRGASAGSEPETQALMALAKEVHPIFNVSYHSFSEIVIYPFGCNPKTIDEKHRKTYEGVGKDLAKKLLRDSGSGSYRAGTSYQLLYNVDGGSVDWMYTDDLIMSYVVEVNSTSQGFQPSYAKWRDRTIEGQRPGWKFLLDRMSGPGIRN